MEKSARVLRVVREGENQGADANPPTTVDLRPRMTPAPPLPELSAQKS